MKFRAVIAGFAGLLLSCAIMLGASSTFAQDRMVIPDGVEEVDGALEYPEGGAVSRGLTQTEREWLAENPEDAVVSDEPEHATGPTHCVAEYEAMEGILIAYEGDANLINTLMAMAKPITSTANLLLYVVCDTDAEKKTAETRLKQAGAKMENVRYIVRTTDTIWIRDYGPRYIIEGNCRAIVDHKYNRPRQNDDKFPTGFAEYKGHRLYSIPLTHGGGNYHLDATGLSYCTRLIDNENKDKTEQQIHDLWYEFQNVDTTFFDPFPQDVDETQHLDMWMQVVADDVVIISEWPNQQDQGQRKITEDATKFMSDRGYTVVRTPARLINGVHYTYTNAVMCNGIVLIPKYSNTTMKQFNDTALSAWKTAAPDKEIIQIDCEYIISLAGALHCIVMHVPPPPGGANPTTYLKNLRGGDIVDGGSAVEIKWISDDDIAAKTMDVLLSLDGGQSFNATLATAVDVKNSFTWNIPGDIGVDTARIKLVVHDADSNTGADESDADFTITGTPLATADSDCSTSVDFNDIDAFSTALLGREVFEASYPGCNFMNADTNHDLVVDAGDVDSFVDRLVSRQ